jgi:hypothetical protein
MMLLFVLRLSLSRYLEASIEVPLSFCRLTREMDMDAKVTLARRMLR